VLSYLIFLMPIPSQGSRTQTKRKSGNRKTRPGHTHARTKKKKKERKEERKKNNAAAATPPLPSHGINHSIR
jgi:hypothetical protein